MRGFVSGAKFRPFSYQEMIAPLQQSTEMHMQLEDAYGQLGTQADLLSGVVDEQANPKAYKKYKEYADDLKSQAAQLSKSGLNTDSRSALLNMRRRYASEIAPIEMAKTKIEQLTKEQRDAMMKDPSMMFDVDYRMKNIDYMLENPNASYEAISGNELTKRASQMASNFAKTIQNNPQYQSILGGQYFQQMQQMGYTPNQIMDTVLNDPNAPKELKQIATTVYEQSGLNKYSPDIQNRGRQFINAGLYEAIGTQKYDNMNNKGYMTAGESARLSMERERLELAKEQQTWAREKWKEDRLGIEMPDGTRVKDLGAGRVRVTKPNGTWEVVASPTSKNTSKPKKSDMFTMLEYNNGDKFSSPSGTFSESDAKLIGFNELKGKAKMKLIEDLAKYDLTPDDVDIYEDYDWLSNSHYRIVRKGAGISGSAPTTSTPVAPASTNGIKFDENIGM